MARQHTPLKERVIHHPPGRSGETAEAGTLAALALLAEHSQERVRT
jgi:hypothetical protein